MNLKKDGWKEAIQSIYGKMGLIFLTASVVAILVFLSDNRRELPQNEKGESVVTRNEYGKGNKEETYRVQIGESEETFTIEIQEQKYTEKERQSVFEEAQSLLENLILGENLSLDEVKSDLNLVTVIPNTGIEVSWALSNYTVMNSQGELKTEQLAEEGTLIKLTAVLTYGEELQEYQFFANLFPPERSRMEQLKEDLLYEIQHRDEESSTKENLSLPSSISGERIIWKYMPEYRAGGIFLMGIAMSLFLYASEEQKKKEAKKYRENQLAYEYPQLINKFTLYIKAGMTVKNAWFKIAEDYEAKKETIGTKVVYEEMVLAMQEMKSGTSERECYEKFGERCGLPVYKKFGAMLSQNLKKGTKGMTTLLNQEAMQAFEERKSMAKKTGEEAGTKMMLPMFMMLAVVLVIIIVPAFLTVQI